MPKDGSAGNLRSISCQTLTGPYCTNSDIFTWQFVVMVCFIDLIKISLITFSILIPRPYSSIWPQFHWVIYICF